LKGQNAEDCPRCCAANNKARTNGEPEPDYPWICPGHPSTREEWSAFEHTIFSWSKDIRHDGLEPTEDSLAISMAGQNRVRIFLAFDPKMPSDARRELIAALAIIMAEDLEVGDDV
jgi:hypothetical protein